MKISRLSRANPLNINHISYHILVDSSCTTPNACGSKGGPDLGEDLVCYIPPEVGLLLLTICCSS